MDLSFELLVISYKSILSNPPLVDKTINLPYIMERMRKEVLFAILAGSFLGLVIAFGIYRANLMMKRSDNSTSTKQTPSPASGLNITVAKPVNEDVLTQAPVEFSGITKAGVWTIVSGEDTDYLAQSQNDGSFSMNADLNGGANQIIVSAVDPQGAIAQQKLLVVFSTEFAKNLVQATPSATPDSTSTAASDSVREKVQEKIEKALQNPKAYIGTVTDIAELTVQIKTSTGEIEQISVDKDQTTIMKTTGQTTREIKFADMAIGDFVVAMGFKNGNNVLAAKRILVTDAIKPLSLYINIVKVDKSNPKEFEATELSGGKISTVVPGDSLTIYLVKNNKKTEVKFVDIMDGDTVIVVGTKVEDSIEARTIFDVVQASPTPTSSE